MKKIIIIICLIVISLGGYFGIKYYLDKDLDKQKQELQNTTDKYGYLDKETISVTTAKFNKEIMDNKLNNPASEEYLVVEDKTYWYGLYDDISLYIKALEFTNDKEKDITNIMAIYYDKNSKNMEMVEKYVRYLIKANNNNITDNEISYLIEEAKKLSDKNEMANNGRGISVGYTEIEDHCQYQVKRLYK